MAEANCPACQAPLPDTQPFAAWCPGCDWNLEPDSAFVEWKETALDKLIAKVRGRYAERQFEELVARDPASLKSRWTLGKAFTYTLAAIINGVPFLFLGAGIWVIAANWPAFWAFFWGGLLILVAYALRPRRNPMPKDLLGRADAPNLYALVDEVAMALGAPKVHALVVSPEFNASFQRAGFLRRPIVTIGLPLWAILDPQERVALLSHEFAHGMNGDSLAHGFVARAINTLLGLAYMIEPDTSEVFGLIFSPVLTALSGSLRWLAYLMVTLFWQRSQEAEFLADFSAAQVGGSEAAASLLRKPALAVYARHVLDPISYGRDWQKHNFFPAFRAFVANLPPLEQERGHRRFKRGDFSKETTHPPDWARLRFLERHASATAYRADPRRMEAIDAELAKFELPFTGSLLAAHYPQH